MAALSNEELNKIRNSVNIVDVIKSYINLDKHGKNYFGICPFHDDHNPSMSVSEDKQIFTCFVCGKSGNVFSFIENYENISFMEAVNKVASISGLSLSSNIKIEKKYKQEYEIYDLAIKYYKNNLKSEQGHNAKEYLKKRNITDEVIKDFDIGVSFNDNNLTKLLLNKKIDENTLIKIGLSNKSETNTYDLFRNRIMFPIHDANGNPVGFSARIYNNESDSKYINTKETYIFKKSEVLFNYHRAKNEAKKLKSLIICEGQMDAIRVYSSGIKNIVATMGTALTKEHINLIKKLNVKVILNMDSDTAGVKATLLNGELLKNSGLEVNVVRLSGAKDPDEYISKYGVDKYRECLNHCISLFDFKMNYLKENKNLDNANDLSDYINNVINELNKSDDLVLREVTINKLSEQYKIDKKILQDKLITIDKKQDIVVSKKPVKKIKKNIRAVEEILYYMMNDIKYANIFEKEINYIPDNKYFEIEKDIQAYIILNNTINIADFISYESGSEKEQILMEIITNHNDVVDLSESVFNDYIKILKKWAITNKIDELKIELKSEVDINRKKEIIDLIAKIKRGSV